MTISAKDVAADLLKQLGWPPSEGELGRVITLVNNPRTEEEVLDEFAETFRLGAGPPGAGPGSDWFERKGTPKFDPAKNGRKEEERKAVKDKPRTSEKGKRKNPRENWIRTARKRMEEARADFRRNIKEAESDAKAREATAKSRATTESRLRTWDAVAEDVFAEGKSLGQSSRTDSVERSCSW